jgi:peptide/nickel transport system ATP-binding protein
VNENGSPLLIVEGLKKYYPVRGGVFAAKIGDVRAVDGVSFDVREGETLGLVGESGCGKSTLGRTVMRLEEPTAGRVFFEGADMAHASKSELFRLRRDVQAIFQDPYSSLNPRMTVGQIIAEPIRVHEILPKPQIPDRVAELLQLVGLFPYMALRYPHELSGGQRQRVGIARALAVDPRVIVCDEAVSALDVSIQAQVINLLEDLRERFGLTYLFIAHDLAVVRHISDRVVVLYLGRVAEVAPADKLFAEPLHPYTRYLISAVPIPDAAMEKMRKRLPLQGEPPSALDPPSGCRFRTRCPIAKSICAEVVPPMIEHRPGHFSACHFPGQF